MKSRLALLAVPLALVSFAASADPSTAVTVQTVRMQKLAQTVTAYGQLVPNPHALLWLSAAQAGRISAVLVTPGTRVKKGQGLVRIAATPQTRAAYQTAQSDLAAARAQLKQTQTLYANGLATQSDLASAQGALANAKSRLAALQAEGVGPHAQVLTASAAGVVTQLLVSRGDWVNAGARIAAFVPGEALWVRLGLTPAQAAGVEAGASVRLEPVFGAGNTLESHVVKVDAQADSVTGLIDAEVPLPANGGPLAGEWVAGTITLHSAELPAVPRSAVLKDARGYYVFTVSNNVAHRVAVEPLVRDRGLVGLKGIEPGAVVVTLGNFELSDGDHVRITNKIDSARQSPSASLSPPRNNSDFRLEGFGQTGVGLTINRHAGEGRHPVEKESRPAAGIPKFDWTPAFAGVTAVGFAGMTRAAFAGVPAVGFAGMTRAAFAGVTTVGFAGRTKAAFAGVTTVGFAGMTRAAFAGVTVMASRRHDGINRTFSS